MAEKLSNFRVAVHHGMSGYFAAMRVDVTTEDGDTYGDVMQTGIGRYPDKADAEKEAKEWAEAEGVPYEG